MKTFSVGIFQWLPTKDGKRLKRGNVAYRIHGEFNNPEAVYRKARKQVKELEKLRAGEQVSI